MAHQPPRRRDAAALPLHAGVRLLTTTAEQFITVDSGRCDLCGACVAVCAPLALTIAGGALEYDADACTACGDCVITCPLEAITSAE